MGGNGGRKTAISCGGMWLRKMGEKWDELPTFHNPIFPEVEDLPHSSLCKHQLTTLTNGKWGIFATHQPPPCSGQNFSTVRATVRGGSFLVKNPQQGIAW